MNQTRENYLIEHHGGGGGGHGGGGGGGRGGGGYGGRGYGGRGSYLGSDAGGGWGYPYDYSYNYPEIVVNPENDNDKYKIIKENFKPSKKNQVINNLIPFIITLTVFIILSLIILIKYLSN
jgi:hypothetical protein